MLKPVTLPSLSNQELMFLIVPEFYGPNTVFLEDPIQPLRHKHPFPILSLWSSPDSFQHIVPALSFILHPFPFYLPSPYPFYLPHLSTFPSFPFLFPFYLIPLRNPTSERVSLFIRKDKSSFICYLKVQALRVSPKIFLSAKAYFPR